MQFGRVDDISGLDLSLPADHPDTASVLAASGHTGRFDLAVGHARWARSYLKDFYPRGTKDELAYYATRLNAIEMNAFFYRIFPPEQVATWRSKVPADFRFFPKVPQVISQFKRLRGAHRQTEDFVHAIEGFGPHLGDAFLQMHPTFGPEGLDDLDAFLADWPDHVTLHVEVRHPGWFEDAAVTDRLYDVLHTHGAGWVLTDAPGRRDMLHMRLPIPRAFVRFTAAGHPVDEQRLDDWVERLGHWGGQGLESAAFFVHQGGDHTSGLLSEAFMRRMDEAHGFALMARFAE